MLIVGLTEAFATLKRYFANEIELLGLPENEQPTVGHEMGYKLFLNVVTEVRNNERPNNQKSPKPAFCAVIHGRSEL
jgi:hypothetical protein